MSNKDSSIPQPESRGIDRVFRSKKELMVANLLGGMAWGLGTVLGATIIVAVILGLLNFFGGMPLVGSFFNDLQESISSGSGF